MPRRSQISTLIGSPLPCVSGEPILVVVIRNLYNMNVCIYCVCMINTIQSVELSEVGNLQMRL